MILFLGRYLIGVLECHQLTPPNKIVLFLAKHLPPIYHHHHYLHCTISLIMKKNSELTSSNSHLTRNEKWKLWVGWHGSSYWLLCLCVLCFVFCAASKTIWYCRVSPYYLIFKKMKIMSYVFRRVSSLPENKDTVVCLLGVRFWRLRPEKKRYSRLSDGLCCCIVFCNGGKFWLQPEKSKKIMACSLSYI